jgi:ribosome maturation factor RimP
MLLEDLREKVADIAAAVAAARGVDVWDVSLGRGPKGWVVKVILDRPEGFVGVDDCADVNVRLRARLELENALAGAFERFRGMLARLKVKGGLRPEAVVGRIVGVGEGGLELDTESGRRRFAFDSVAEAKLEPELPGFEKSAPPKKKARVAPATGRRR